MNTKQTIPRLDAGLSGLLGVVLVVLFFLPWLEVNCTSAGRTERVAQATGLQLSTGELAIEDDAQDRAEAADDREGPDARPWFFLCLLAAAAIAVTGLLGLVGRMAPGFVGASLVVLGLVGAVLMVMAMNVDYPELQQDIPSLGGALEREIGPVSPRLHAAPAPAAVASLVLYLVVLVLGIVNLVVPSVLSHRKPSMPDV